MEQGWALSCAVNNILSKWRGHHFTMRNTEGFQAFPVRLIYFFNVLLTQMRRQGEEDEEEDEDSLLSLDTERFPPPLQTNT